MGSTVYDSRIRPNGMNDTDAATLVTVNLFVRSFSKIDDVKMVRGQFGVEQMYVRNL